MKSIKRLIGDKKFYMMVLGIAVPVMIQNGITNFVSLLDNIMVGQMGTEQMSGVAIANQLMFVFNLCVFGAVSGVSIFSAQYYGKRDWEGMRHAFRLKIMVCVFICAMATLLFVLKGEALVSLYLKGTEGEGDLQLTLAEGMKYLYVMLAGLIAFTFSQIYASTLREMGETKVPMIAGIVAVLTNLALNWLLIFGNLGCPKLGVVGAAIATVVSRYIEVLIIVVWTHCHSKVYQFIQGAYKSLRVPMSLVKQVAIKGTPLMINEALWSSGIAMLTQCYSERGLEVVAAMNIAQTITNLFNVVYIALGSSVGIVVGPLLGANEMEDAKDTASKMIAFSVVSCLGIGLVLFILAPLFPKMYNTGDDVRAIATSVIRVGACFMPIFSFEHATYFTLRAGGKTIITFLFDSCFMWVAAVPVAFCLSRFTLMAIVPMYICVNLMDFIKATIGFILVKKGVWVNNIVNDMKSEA